MAAHIAPLSARHIQNYSEATSLEPHWGYLDRALPCTNDAGSCAYLDQVYHAHDLGMLYMGIIWASIGGILLVWGLWRRSTRKPSDDVVTPPTRASIDETESKREASGLSRESSASFSRLGRLGTAIATESRRRLLPDGPHAIFGRTSRLQVVVLAILAGYLLIWTFLGYTYQTWKTPVKKMPGVYNTRTSLGPWSDRVGVLAYGLLPLSIMLSSRENVLSLITGVPYHHFNFLHRWLGYIILIQSLLHTIGWVIIEARLYQPQPSTANTWIRETYIVWGCVAVILILILWVLTLPFVVRRTGYEFFRKAHYVLAMIFIGACWGHWSHLQCFLLPSLLLWGLDRAVRLVRTFLLHYNLIAKDDGTTWIGFRSTEARAQIFKDAANGDVVRLDLDQQQTKAWDIGQHYFLTFTEGSIWQSHPFTPLSLPHVTVEGTCRHSYLFRAKGGETKKVATLLSERMTTSKSATSSTGVIFTGPYGQSITDAIRPTDNVLCVAGGTGVTFVLPVLLHLARTAAVASPDRRITLIWVVRHASDAEWIRPELDALARNKSVTIHVFSTRDHHGDESSLDGDSDQKHSNEPTLGQESDETGNQSSEEIKLEHGQATVTLSKNDKSRSSALMASTHPDDHRPDLSAHVQQFIQSTVSGATTVVASGPGSMLSELRRVVARSNSGAKVLRGDEHGDVRFIADNRLEW